MAAAISLKGAKTKGKEVAKSHEPTPQRARTLACCEKRRAEKISGTRHEGHDVGGGRRSQSRKRSRLINTDIEVGYQLMWAAIGSENRDFLFGTIDSLAMAAHDGR